MSEMFVTFDMGILVGSEDGLRLWDGKAKCGSLALYALDRYFAIMGLNDMLDNGKP